MLLQTLRRASRSNTKAFNGVVVKLLRHPGKEAPVNRVFYGALAYLDKKIRAEAAGY